MGGNIAIIGGGLAGTACAYLLKKHGFTPVIYEASHSLAAGASGNTTGIYNPRFFAETSPQAKFYQDAFWCVCDLFPHLAGINYSPHGTLHLMETPDDQRRFEKMKRAWDWPESHLQILDQKAASDIAGVALPCGAVFLPTSGTVSPLKLCEAYAKGCAFHLNRRVTALSQRGEGWNVDGEYFDIVIMACGYGALTFEQTSHLPIFSVRGQLAQFKSTLITQALKVNISYGGYITPVDEAGAHTCGATFQKWLTHCNILDEDNNYIREKLEQAIPAMTNQFDTVMSARAALRTASRDVLPIIGRVSNQRTQKTYSNFYTTLAHGSHGIVTSYMAANMVLQAILGANGHTPFSRFESLRF